MYQSDAYERYGSGFDSPSGLYYNSTTNNRKGGSAMDPDYVFNLYKNALREGDVALAEDYLASLRSWISRGGTRPLGWV